MPSRLLRPLISPAALKFTAGSFWAGATLIFLDNNVFTTTPIRGPSMSPTLSPDHETSRTSDVVLWKVWCAQRGLKRGDVVHFSSPTSPEVFAVKRVVGLPGDTVLLDPRRRPQSRAEPQPAAAEAWDAWRGRAVVPPGHVWVEGDNWRKTNDSNWYGPLSKSLISGRAVAVIWPWGRLGGRPWEGWDGGRTRVIEGVESGDWTRKGLPVELAEVGDLGLGKG